MHQLKSTVLQALPAPLLRTVKKLHYARAVRDFSVPHAGVLRAIVGPGDCVLDLGANVGWYTRILSEFVGSTGLVYSVEPVPPTFELLSHCIRKLRLTNVVLINSAVSDHAGWALMEVPLYSQGGENFYQARLTETSPGGCLRTFRVPVTSVDALLLDHSRGIAFIKCDVEGQERAVILGAVGLIRRWLPALFIEITTDPDMPGAPAHELTRWLREVGYHCYWFDGTALVRRRAGDRSIDYFFLTRRHLTRLAEAQVHFR